MVHPGDHIGNRDSFLLEGIFDNFNKKPTRSSPDFDWQMFYLVGLYAHPAGFEPTACRLGVAKGGRRQRASEFFRDSVRLDI